MMNERCHFENYLGSIHRIACQWRRVIGVLAVGFTASLLTSPSQAGPAGDILRGKGLGKGAQDAADAFYAALSNIKYSKDDLLDFLKSPEGVCNLPYLDLSDKMKRLITSEPLNEANAIAVQKYNAMKLRIREECKKRKTNQGQKESVKQNAPEDIGSGGEEKAEDNKPKPSFRKPDSWTWEDMICKQKCDGYYVAYGSAISYYNISVQDKKNAEIELKKARADIEKLKKKIAALNKIIEDADEEINHQEATKLSIQRSRVAKANAQNALSKASDSLFFSYEREARLQKTIYDNIGNIKQYAEESDAQWALFIACMKNCNKKANSAGATADEVWRGYGPHENDLKKDRRKAEYDAANPNVSKKVKGEQQLIKKPTKVEKSLPGTTKKTGLPG